MSIFRSTLKIAKINQQKAKIQKLAETSEMIFSDWWKADKALNIKLEAANLELEAAKEKRVGEWADKSSDTIDELERLKNELSKANETIHRLEKYCKQLHNDIYWLY